MIDEITALRVENERLAAELAKAEALSREQVAGAYLAAEERLAMEQGALITRRVISAINSLTPADATAALEARDARIRADERATNTEVTALVDALKCAELIVEDQICNDLYVSGHVENSLRRIRTAIYAWESTNEQT